MSSNDECLSLERCIAESVFWRRTLQENPNINDIVSPIINHSPQIDTLVIDCNIMDEGIEWEVFTAIVSQEQITGLQLTHATALDVNCWENMLRIAVPLMPSLSIFGNMPVMTESEAQRILPILRASDSLIDIGIDLGKAISDASARQLKTLLQGPRSFQGLSLSWKVADGDNEQGRSALSSETAFATICDGISSSSSLGTIYVQHGPPECEANAAAQSLAHAIASGSKSGELCVVGTSMSYRWFSNMVRDALLSLQVSRDFDLCFKEEIDRDETADALVLLLLDKNPPWRPLLASPHVPLSLWPRILEKANHWNEATSHSSLDALYFLVKEKNVVLLQNVRRRKIRKRKRYQMTTY